MNRRRSSACPRVARQLPRCFSSSSECPFPDRDRRSRRDRPRSRARPRAHPARRAPPPIFCACLPSDSVSIGPPTSVLRPAVCARYTTPTVRSPKSDLLAAFATSADIRRPSLLKPGHPRRTPPALDRGTERVSRHARRGATTRAPHHRGAAFARRPERSRHPPRAARRAAGCRASSRKRREIRFARAGVPRDAPRGIVVAERALGRRVRTPRARSQGRARQDRPHLPRVRATFLGPENYSARVLHFAHSRVSRPKTPIARASDLA